MGLSHKLDNVQKTIISVHRERFQESPTPMKLQKLCYYTQGYRLAEGEELFPQDFQAWQHGPVIPDLYSKYKHYKWRQIADEVSIQDQSIYSFIEEIVSAYGSYDGAMLSTMTHREKPWLDARGDLDESEGSNSVISKKALHDFFSSKLKSYA